MGIIPKYFAQVIATSSFKQYLVIAEGLAGTMYFVDTAGLHRGGYHPVPGERRVSLTTFSTAADLMETKIRAPKNFKVSKTLKRVLV